MPSVSPVGVNASSKEDALVGTLIDNRYRVIEVIGVGGMGKVYRAHHIGIDKQVALKTISRQLAADDVSIRRFEQEAKTASALTHTNLVTVKDCGTTFGGEPYLVMDYLEGETLSSVIRAKSADVSRLIGIFKQVCAGMSYAHQHGVIHRDLKPSNIMLLKTEQGDDLVKVFDFGVAKSNSGSQGDELTRTGELVGSPRYMSPEQSLGHKLDHRADIYSFGCVMFECLTGVPPFRGENAIETVVKHINEPPPKLRQANADAKFPEAFELVIDKCLKKDAKERYQSFDELLEDLLKAERGDRLFVTTSPTQSVPRVPRSRLIAASFALFFSIGLLGYIALGNKKALAPPSSPVITPTSLAPPTVTTPAAALPPTETLAEAHKLLQEGWKSEATGNWTTALSQFERAKTIFEGLNATQTGEYVSALMNYAMCLRETGRPLDSLQYFETAGHLAVKVCGVDSLTVGEVCAAYADALAKTNQLPTAEFMANRADQLFGRFPQASKSDVGWAKLRLAWIYRLEKKLQQSESIYKKFPQKEGVFATPFTNAMESYGYCLLELGKRAQAESELTKFLAELKKQGRGKSADYLRVKTNLAQYYREDGKEKQARKLEEQ